MVFFFSHVYITEVMIMVIISAVILLLIAIGQFYFVFAKNVENAMPVLSLVRLILCIIICILVFRRM